MITVVGEALVDVIVDAQGEVTSVVGGAALNTARAIARLGVPCSFLGGVSTDPLGRRIRRQLEQDGVRLAIDEPVDAPSTLAIATLDGSRSATYRFLTAGTAAAEVTPQLALAQVPDDCRALHVGTLGLVLEPIAHASVALVASAPRERVVMVDPNCRPTLMAGSEVFASALDAVLGRADVVKVSAEDLEFLFPGVDAPTAASTLQRDSGAVVLFTDGGSGVQVHTPTECVVLDVPPVEVVDTVGAGDAFGGGFLAHWIHSGLRREDLGDIARVVAAVRFGILVAAVTCGRVGADPPRAHEVPGGWA